MTRDQKREFERKALRETAGLKRRARRLAGDARADDLVQETFVRAFAAWTRLGPDSNVSAWLYRILRNTFLNEHARLVRESPLSDELEDYRKADGALSLDLRRALDELPDSLRETLLAVDVEGLAYHEAAERTSAPIGTVMSRLHRARERMALRLAA